MSTSVRVAILTTAQEEVELVLRIGTPPSARVVSRCCCCPGWRRVRWCHRYYEGRPAASFTNRTRTTRLLAAALLPHAQSERDANPAVLGALLERRAAAGRPDPRRPGRGQLSWGPGRTLTKLERCRHW